MKKIFSIIIAFVLSFVLTITPAFAFPGFAKKTEETNQAFEEAYGWNNDDKDAHTWQGKDGEEYTRLEGHQKESYEDIFKSMYEDCLELEIVKKESESSGRGGGGKMAAIARAEVDAPDCMETGPNTNNVKYNTWYYGHEVEGENYKWCAVFISWCAEQCGYLESGLYNKSCNVQNTFDYLTDTNGFESHSGYELAQFGGGGYSACVGDIVCFGDQHIGIVTAVTENSIEITQGNTGDRVTAIQYSAGSPGNAATASFVHVIYPGGDVGEGAEGVFFFLTEQMGMNAAAACGVLANIECESGFDPTCDVWDVNGMSMGICQWHNERRDALIAFCEANGYDNLSLEGQLNYLAQELPNNYSGVYNTLMSVEDSAEGAYEASLKWTRDFEVCEGAWGAEGDRRAGKARDTYYPQFSGMTSSSSSS